MVNKIKKDTQKRMEKSIEALKNQISKVYIGRASPTMLYDILVKCYGVVMPLQQLASITIENFQTLIVTVFDSALLEVIKKAIIASNLDFNPSLSGTVIRVSLPPVTEERRRDLIKFVRNGVEQGKISIRNIRRDANDKIKALLKNRVISVDDERRAQHEIQKLTDDFIKKINEVLKEKEKELLKF